MRHRFKKHKFGAKPTELDGIKFASRLEANHYVTLKRFKATGEIVQFLRQVPFYFPGGIKYVCDWLIFWADGRAEFADSKGVETKEFKMKMRLMEAHYPEIKVTI